MAETPLERGLLPRHRVRAFLDRRGRPALARSWPLALGAILLLGGLLRFHGLDWDQPEGADDPLQMHPHERFLSLVTDRLDWPDSAGGYFDTSTSPLGRLHLRALSNRFDTARVIRSGAPRTSAGSRSVS